MAFQKKVFEEMRNLNLNQKRIITDVLVNLSVAFISICTVTPIIFKLEFDFDLLIFIFIIIIISILMIIYSVDLMKK